jgi:predicted ferric reductase
MMALWRAKWNIKYETWHLTHMVLAMVAVAAGLAHMVGWGFYLTAPWTLAMQPDGHRGFRFRPGQFGWLTVWDSPFKVTQHPFSFSSSTAVTDRLALSTAVIVIALSALFALLRVAGM